MVITMRKNRLKGMLVLSLIVVIITIIMSISPKNKSCIISFINSANTQEQVEIFSIEKGKVIKVVQINETAVAESKKYLQGIVGIYPKIKAFPDKGYIIKIPFDPNIIVKNHFLNDYDISSIHEVFILLPEDNALIFTGFR